LEMAAEILTPQPKQIRYRSRANTV
jgi:hypothetical protein